MGGLEVQLVAAPSVRPLMPMEQLSLDVSLGVGSAGC
jgi:hypothetical protein